MQKTILFIGGGIETLPAIAQAKSIGLYTVVSDMDVNAPGSYYADDFLKCSTYDVSDTLSNVMDFTASGKKIDGVMCVGTDVPLTVASIAKALSIPGISTASAELAMDKVAMKKKFREDSVPIPNFKRIKCYDELVKSIVDWGYPIIIKPVDSRGARGVLKLTKDVDKAWAWEHSKKNSPTNRVMIEKYLDGPQISTESIMINRKCYTAGFSDRNYEFLEKYSPYIIENGGDLPTKYNNQIKAKINEVLERASLSMGIENGVVKGDIVIYNGEPYVIELAARLSGGYFCTHQIPLSTGVDLVGNAIKLCLGEDININDLKPKYEKFICQRFFFPNPGTLNYINGLEQLEKDTTIEYYKIYLKPGQKVEEPVSHPSRAGMVIASGDSRSNARKNAINAINAIKFEYET